MDKLINYLLSVLFFFSSSQNPGVKNTNIILTGDIMLGRSVMLTSLGINDPTYPFKFVADKLNNADIVFANLENPIVVNCPEVNNGFKFCADLRMVDGLKYAGVDVVSLANNHTNNYGRDGVTQTEKILTDSGIKWVGDGNLEIIEKNGTKFGFLGFDYVDNLPKDSDFQLIRDSKSKVDELIVMVHWGVEYTAVPTDKQKAAAHKLVDAGADVVTGAHPHWVQTTEFVNGKPVFYSLGNFVFDQSWSEQTKHGQAIELTYKNNHLLQILDHTTYMQNLGQPQWTN